MSSTLGPTAEDLRPTEPSNDAKIRTACLDGAELSLGKRTARRLRRFLIVFCMGVGATLGWQSYGTEIRAIIANSYPQLGWLAPQTAAFAETAPEITPTIPATTSLDQNDDFKAISVELATLRQSMDQHLAAVAKSMDQFLATQQQMASDIAKLKAAERDKISTAPAPRPAAAPARRAVPLPSQEPPVR
jgi:hypothetical protein